MQADSCWRSITPPPPPIDHRPPCRFTDALLAFVPARSPGKAAMHPAAAVASCERTPQPDRRRSAVVSIAAACPAAEPITLTLASHGHVQLGLRHDGCIPGRA